MEITHPPDQKETVTVRLPDELMHYNILPRVPAKSLLRFKCVSKDWYNLTKNPTFIRIYQKHALEADDYRNSLVVRLVYDEIHGYFFYTFLDASHAVDGRNIETMALDIKLPYTRIVGSCNGVICLESEDGKLALCNPVTREFCWLANPPNWESMGWFVYGFGYDCVSHDYKIARIDISPRGRITGIIKVYSTNSQSWRETEGVVPPSFDVVPMSGYGVCLNNTLHWIVSDQEEYLSIMTFDLRSEELGKMLLPTKINLATPMFDTLVVSCGLLYFLRSDYTSTKHSVWVMKKYGVSESWTEQYTFTREDVLSGDATLYSYISKKGGGGGKALMIDNRRPDELIWYNCEDKSTRKVNIMNDRGTLQTTMV